MSVPTEGHGGLLEVLSLDRAGDGPFCHLLIGLTCDAFTVEFPVLGLLVWFVVTQVSVLLAE